MASRKIAVIIGSMRKESFNRKAAKAMMLLAPPTLDLEIIEIDQLPMYNQDDEASPPPLYTEFRDRIRQHDGILFFTPEYNRSIPGVLKNAIDVGSRPYGQSAWNGKPCAVISITPGALGAFGANHHLRQCLSCLNMPTMPQEAYISGVAGHFDGDTLTNDSTKAFLQTIVDNFASWVERHAD